MNILNADYDWVAVAREAYAAYGKQTGFKNFRGDKMPEFADLGAVIQLAWVEATKVSVRRGWNAARNSLDSAN